MRQESGSWSLSSYLLVHSHACLGLLTPLELRRFFMIHVAHPSVTHIQDVARVKVATFIGYLESRILLVGLLWARLQPRLSTFQHCSLPSPGSRWLLSPPTRAHLSESVRRKNCVGLGLFLWRVGQQVLPRTSSYPPCSDVTRGMYVRCIYNTNGRTSNIILEP